MEIEKPFKCNACNSQFTNEDHLQVHKKRHEMSLSLNLTKPGGQQSALDGFVDETPTPTRFFRNCEEVGLFQDLQNVNPFDEQFSKAASSTPSNGTEPFDFNLAISGSSVPTSTSASISNSNSSSGGSSSNNNKRRYSDQDTLNTPQVFGYIMNSTSSSTTNTCSTTSILTPMPPTSTTVLEEINSKERKTHNSDDSVNTQIEITDTVPDDTQDFQSESAETTREALLLTEGINYVIGRTSSNKSKTSLRLNLTPQLLVTNSTEEDEDSPQTKRSKATPLLVPEKKAELLERNRAAASRSRHRRKQWVCNLEVKCQMLESLLAQTRSELLKQQTDNQILKNELSRHANCDVTRGVERQSHQPNQQVHILVQHKQPQPMPNILRQASQPQVVSSVSVNQPIDASSQGLISRVKAKRGRPRKGQERRVHAVAFHAPPATSQFDVPVKIQLVPISRTDISGIEDS